MCYEDILKRGAAAAGISGEDEEGLRPGNPATRTWSVGHWVQTTPSLDMEALYDWYALMGLVTILRDS